MNRLLATTTMLVFASAITPSFSANLQPSAASDIGTTIVQQRKDVLEISIPQPRTGPSSPVPLCSPGDTVCY